MSLFELVRYIAMARRIAYHNLCPIRITSTRRRESLRAHGIADEAVPYMHGVMHSDASCRWGRLAERQTMS